MRWLNSKILSVVVLLVFAGQVVAMPFMACCEDMLQLSDMNTMQPAMEQTAQSRDLNIHVQAEPSMHDHKHMPGQDQESHSGMDCDFCGVISIALQSEIAASQKYPTKLSVFFNSVTHPPFNNSYYRPPITA